MKKTFFVSFSLLLFIACSHKVASTSSTTGSSTADAAKAETMYNTDIKPLLENKCAPCHFPDKGGNKPAFDSYASASKQVAEMLVRVQLKPEDRGFMPFRSKKEPLTATEIASLKAWQAALGK